MEIKPLTLESLHMFQKHKLLHLACRTKQQHWENNQTNKSETKDNKSTHLKWKLKQLPEEQRDWLTDKQGGGGDYLTVGEWK